MARSFGDVVQRQPLRRRHLPPWDADTRHEAEGLLHLLAAALGPDVAVILLIDAVELRQLRVVFVQLAGDDLG